MKSIIKIIAILVGLFLPFFLFIMLYRLANQKEVFFGFQELLIWFESKDFYYPIGQAVKDISHLNETYSSWFASWDVINNAWDFFLALGKSIGAILGYMSYPVILLYEIINAIVTYIMFLVDFLQYIVV